jgi:hypothetical protein
MFCFCRLFILGVKIKNKNRCTQIYCSQNLKILYIYKIEDFMEVKSN